MTDPGLTGGDGARAGAGQSAASAGQSAASAGQIAAAVSAGTLSAEEAVQAALTRLTHEDLRAVITICGERALARARHLDRGGESAPRIGRHTTTHSRNANATGRLRGVPLLVKDLIDTQGVRTTYASSIYRDHVPRRSAPAVAALEAEGAVVVAKANADEFAWGVTGQNQHYGDVVNPRFPGCICGGSSAGNAAALAAGIVPLALGTDTGGSVRMPAAACGVVGLKPSVGMISVAGVHPLVPSFDTIGPMARSVSDCAIAYAVLTGDAVPAPGIAGHTVGVLTRPPNITGAAEEHESDDRAADLAARLRACGARVREVELPVPAADMWPMFLADAAAAHAATFPSRREEYGATVRAKLELASRVGADELSRARTALAQWRVRAATEPDVDLIASPTLGLRELPPAGVDELDIRVPFSAYTRPFSYLGWPAIAIGGLQLAGRDAGLLLAAALAIEAEGAGR